MDDSISKTKAFALGLGDKPSYSNHHLGQDVYCWITYFHFQSPSRNPNYFF